MSFFVTGRLVGESDSEVFTKAVTGQFASLTGEAAEMPATPGAWRRHLGDMLCAAGAGGYFRDRARGEIVKGLLATGCRDRADRAARAVTAHAYYRGHAMAMIVGAMAGAGNPAGAKRLAEEIREPHSRIEALAELAAVAAAYDPEHAASLVRQAESAADQIPSGDQRYRSLGKLASRVTETGGGAAAVPARLLAQVIDSGGWPDVLPAVARIAPAALFPLGDTVLAFAGRFPPEYQ